MRAHILLILLMTNFFMLLSTLSANANLSLYSPANEAYVDGSEITFSWAPIYGWYACSNGVHICSDSACNNVFFTEADWNINSLTTRPNLANGTKFYWYANDLCVSEDSDMENYVSDIRGFTTYDKAYSVAFTSSPSSSVTEGQPVQFTAQASGAPLLNDYLYKFFVDTYVDGNFYSRDEEGATTANTFTWLVPNYDASKTYKIGVFAGTSSYESYHGSFIQDSAAISPGTYKVRISAAPVITTVSLRKANYGAGYNDRLDATGGLPPYTWSVHQNNAYESFDPLPSWLTLTSDGFLNGVAITNSSYSIAFDVKDSQSPPVSATRGFQLVVVPQLIISTPSLYDGDVGKAYSDTLTASGGYGSHSWSLSPGSSLPAVLTLSSAGLISGTPQNGGSFTFTVKVSDGQSPAVTTTQQFTIVVRNLLAITTPTALRSGISGTAYSESLTATGGAGGYVYSLAPGSNLPNGLSLSTTGAIQGTPSATGNYSFTIIVADSRNSSNFTATKTFTLAVAYPQVQITTGSLLPGVQGAAYIQTLTATGGNKDYTWSVLSGDLPPGLNLNASGVITGTPLSGGNYTFTAQVSDGQTPTPATAQGTFSISVAYLPLAITTSTLADGAFGTTYSQPLVAIHGKTPYSWSITSGSLPSGLTLDAASGVVTGVPTNVGNFGITVGVADSQGTPATATASYSFNITNGPMQRCTDFETVEGFEASPKVCTRSTTNVITGVVDHDQELFAIKGDGIRLNLFYQSIPPYNGPLGIGWSHTFDTFITVSSADGSVVLQDGARNKSFYSKSGSSYVSPPGDYSTLVKNGDGSYVLSYRDGVKKNFLTNGKLASIVDRYNNTITCGYTGNDLTTITDQAHRITTIDYDQTVSPHRIKTVTDPNNNVYDFTYQGSTLYRVTNPATDPAISPERGYWEYQYYPDNFLKTKRDPNGNTSTYSYYSDHRMEFAQDPEGLKRSIIYPSSTDNLRTSKLIEKDGGQWLYTYDMQKGVIKQKTDPGGHVTSYTYYPSGTIKSSTEPKDGAVRLTTFYTYDSYGNPLTRTVPADLNSYSPAIDPEAVTDPAWLASLNPPIKVAMRYSYDTSNFDRLTGVRDERVSPVLSATFAYSTENGGEVVTTTSTPGNYLSILKRSPDGRIQQTIDANLKSTSYAYYPDTTANQAAGIVGLLMTATDPAGIVTTITSYDKNGNPLEVTVQDTDGTVRLTSAPRPDTLNRVKQLTRTASGLPVLKTQYGHDNIGNTNSVIDAESRQTKYEFNYNGKVRKLTDAKGNDTVFKYSGSEGNGVDSLVGVYDPKVTKITPLESQPHTSYNYDKLGRLDSEVDPLGKKLHLTYYDNGLVKEKYDATDATPGRLLASFKYNDLGQVTEKNYSDSTYDHYTYYPDGKLWTATNQNIGYTYSYYDDGRLQQVTASNGQTISYDEYDGIGQRKKVTLLKGSGVDERVINYDYDGANRPWHITSNAGTFTYLYDKLGRRDTLAYANNTLTDWGFDDLNRLTSVTHSVVNGATLAAFNYTDFDKVGNIKAVSGSKSAAYGYDELYRLLSVSSTKSEALTYDPAGNRQTGPGLTDNGYQPNAANQLAQGRKLGYIYDNFGNQTTKSVPGATDKSWVQTWDLQNRLIKVEKQKGSQKRTVTFTYDALGRRIGKVMTTVLDGVSQEQHWVYVYDGSAIAVEFYTDESNVTTKTFYTQGPQVDEHLAMERGGQFYYYHADGQGSVAAITDAAGATVQAYDYDSYGMIYPTSTFRDSFAFTGREWDKETGLYYYRARYYDPMEGRFISKDPIGFNGGINLYNYVQNNPVNFIDPTGLVTAIILSGGTDGNPFGHIALATTGAGIYSYGTADPYGGSVSSYLASQLANRFVEIVLLNTTPQQEADLRASMVGNKGKYSVTSHNCATNVGKAMYDAGLTDNSDPSILPGNVFSEALSLPGAQLLTLPKGSKVPSSLTSFNPR